MHLFQSERARFSLGLWGKNCIFSNLKRGACKWLPLQTDENAKV